MSNTSKLGALTLILFFISGSFIAAFNPVSASDLVEDSWNTQTPMRQPRLALGVAVVDGKIYAIGGYSENGWVGTNERYDPKTDEWVTRKSMPTPRADFAIAAYQGEIYCIGGTIPRDVCNVNEVYNPATNSWRTKSPMPFKAGNLRAHIVDGNFFVLCGPTLYMYDPITDVWTEKTSMPSTAATTLASAVADNKIIVINTISGSSLGLAELKVLIYDPTTDLWSEKTGKSPENVFINAVGATSGVYRPQRVYCFGQSYVPEELSITVVYNPAKDKWSTAEPLPVSRSQFGVAVVDDILYIIGGNTYDTRIVCLSANEQYVPIDYDNFYLLVIALLLTIGIVSSGLFFYFRKKKKTITSQSLLNKQVPTSDGLYVHIC